MLSLSACVSFLIWTPCRQRLHQKKFKGTETSAVGVSQQPGDFQEQEMFVAIACM